MGSVAQRQRNTLEANESNAQTIRSRRRNSVGVGCASARRCAEVVLIDLSPDTQGRRCAVHQRSRRPYAKVASAAVAIGGRACR